MEIDMEIDDVKPGIDSDYEEEEYLVYIDIEPTSLAETQIREAQKLKLFGMDKSSTLLQIINSESNQFFEGDFDISMGTHLFFEKDEEAPVDELYCRCESYYRYRAKTNKVLKMSRVLVKEKATESDTVHDKDISSLKGQLRIDKTYEEQLDQLLVPGRNRPRRIPEDDNCEHLSSYISAGEENRTSSANDQEEMSSQELRKHR